MIPETCFDTEIIDGYLRDNVQSLYETLRPPAQSGRKHGHEIRYGKKSGAAVVVSGPAKGRITLFDGDGKGRSPLQFIQNELTIDFPHALAWAAVWCGISPSQKLPQAEMDTQRRKLDEDKRRALAAKDKDERKRVAQALKIAEQRQNIEGTPAQAYLASRGITVWPDEVIWYHPATDNAWGALLVVATNEAAELRAIQRVFLTPDGAKAPVKPPKRTNGITSGAAVRLPGPSNQPLCLSEGPESGLSVWQATGLETWITLGSIAKIADNIPADREIIVARDGDPPNSQASKALANAVTRMLRLNPGIRVTAPEIGQDANDILVSGGNCAVRQWIHAAKACELPTIAPRYPAQSGTVISGRQQLTAALNAWGNLAETHWKQKAACLAATLEEST